ncbi:TPA: hypothetical protein ACTYH4_005971 [Klebsiella variicola]
MNIETVNELIASLESAGELSIREQKFLKLAKAHVQLAAEIVALKSAVTQQIELRSEIKKAGRPPHADFWIQSIYEAEDKVNLALKETTATDRIVAGIKADGVESGIKTIMVMLNHQAPGVSDAINVLRIYCSKLREVAKHD